MRHRVRRPSREPVELNITAFMNLMVILVPFLLITAVFSQIAIIELNLPPAAANTNKAKNKGLNLEVIIKTNSIDVSDGRTGLIKRIVNTKQGYDYKTLSDVLRRVKGKFPNKKNAMILAQSNTSYDTLVQVMDAVRVVTVPLAGASARIELFPDISIGDAPGVTIKQVKKRRRG